MINSILITRILMGEKMKSMTCKQLGGACEKIFKAETFEEIAELSKNHGIQMFKNSDEAHKKAMDKMKTLMQDPIAMQKWFEGKRNEFESLPDD